ncbi:unnamed protein product, partial [Chrysoparadoxa australica]
IQAEFPSDPNAGLGETFVQNRVSYMSLGAGVHWNVISPKEEERFFLSFSAFNLNKPRETFFGEYTEVPVTYLLSSGITLARSRRFIVEPQLYYIRTGRRNEYQLIGSFKYLFDNTNPYDLVEPGALELLINAGSVPDVGLGLVWHQPNFKIGGSYYVPVSQKQIAFYQSRFQIALGLGFVTWKKKPQSIVIESHEPRRFIFNQQAQPKQKASEIQQINDKLSDLDEVRSLQFELTKDFKFLQGKSELIGKNDPFLKDLTLMLKENPGY